jgi:hypothetical protein
MNCRAICGIDFYGLCTKYLLNFNLFAGNSNLVYTIIRKRNVFHALANLPVDHSAISKALAKKSKRLVQAVRSRTDSSTSSASQGVAAIAGGGDISQGEQIQEGAFPAQEAPPGTLKTTLAATPAVSAMTERTHAHKQHQLGLPEDQVKNGGKKE